VIALSKTARGRSLQGISTNRTTFPFDLAATKMVTWPGWADVCSGWGE
jgi:hypothetical protein